MSTRSPVPPPGGTGGGWLGPVLTLAAVAALGGAVYLGIHGRAEANASLAQETDANAVPTVDVVLPLAGAPDDGLVLPGNTQPFSDAAIYARTNGYLKRWTSDIGAHVKRGQVLAEIDAPEVDAQLRQAVADLATAQATLSLATITAERNEALLKTRSVSTQERDNAAGALASAKANLQSRQAVVAQLSQLQSFEKIEAPFDGIVTARNVDIGALITAGSTSSARELFHMVATDTLRIYVAVPESYAPSIQTGAAATVTLDEFPGQTFKGIVARNANAIDAASRTLLVEVDVDNANGQLLPGAYAFVRLTLAGHAQSMTIPANTLLFRREGLRVGVVHDGKVDLAAVKIGRDYGDKVEIVSGLRLTDQIVINPMDSLLSGMPVHVNPPKPAEPAK